ncbi:hypothetical protein Tco_1354323 [Tanacetum coccineum]
MIARGAPNLAKRDFRNLLNYWGRIGGERFRFTHLTNSRLPTRLYLLPREDGNGAIKSMPTLFKDFSNWMMVGPEKTEFKDLFGCDVYAQLMSPGWVLSWQ